MSLSTRTHLYDYGRASKVNREDDGSDRHMRPLPSDQVSQLDLDAEALQ